MRKRRSEKDGLCLFRCRGSRDRGRAPLGAEVAKVFKNLLGGMAPGVDKILPEYLRALDVVGLLQLTRLCNIQWTLEAVLLDWQTEVV